MIISMVLFITLYSIVAIFNCALLMYNHENYYFKIIYYYLIKILFVNNFSLLQSYSTLLAFS